MKLCPWLPDYCTGALLVVAGVHNEEVLENSPRSFDGTDALDRTVGQLTKVHLATKPGTERARLSSNDTEDTIR